VQARSEVLRVEVAEPEWRAAEGSDLGGQQADIEPRTTGGVQRGGRRRLAV
jgi:hypothetical protein